MSTFIFANILFLIGYCNHTWFYSDNTSTTLPYHLYGHISISHKNGLHILGGKTIKFDNNTNINNIEFDSNVIKYCNNNCHLLSNWDITTYNNNNMNVQTEFVCLLPKCYTIINDIVFIIGPYNKQSSRSLMTNILVYNL
eukprot:547500_1